MSALRSRLRKAAEAAEDQPSSPTDDASSLSPPQPLTSTTTATETTIDTTTATTRSLPSLEQRLLQGGAASAPPTSTTIQSTNEDTTKHRHSSDSSVSGLTASPYTRQETENQQNDHPQSNNSIPVVEGNATMIDGVSSTTVAPDLSQYQRRSIPPIRHPSDDAFHSINTPQQLHSPPELHTSVPNVNLTVHHVRQPTQLPPTSPLSSPMALLSDEGDMNGGGYDDANTRLDCLLQLSPHTERANPLEEDHPTSMTGANIAMAYHRYKRYQSMSWEATNVVWDFLDTFDKIKRELERMDQEESSEEDGSYSSLTSSTDGAVCDRAERRRKATRKVPMGRNSGSQERNKSIVAVFDRVTGRDGLSSSAQQQSARIGSVTSSSGRVGGGKLGATTTTTTTTSATTPTSSSLATAPDSPPHWTLPAATNAASSSSSGPSAVGSSRSVFLARTMLASIESLRMNMEPYKPLRGLALRGMELRNELTELQAHVPSASSSMTSSISSVKRNSMGKLKEMSNTELKDMLHRIVRVSVGLPGMPTEDECEEDFDAEGDDAMWSANQYDDLELMRAASAFGHERRNSQSTSRRFGPPRHNSNTDTHSAIGSGVSPPPQFRNNSGAGNGVYSLDEIPGMGELASSVLMSPGVGDYTTTTHGGGRSVSFTGATKGIDPPSLNRKSGDAGNGGEDDNGTGGRAGGFASRKEGNQRSFKLTFLGEQALTEHHAQDYTNARGKPRRPTSAETTLSIVSATTAKPIREHDRLNEEDDEALGTMYIGRLNVLQALGKGAQGEVKLVQDLLETDPRTGQPPLMAMKIVKRKMFSTLAHTREIAVMKQLRHKNIIRLREVIQDPSVKEVYLLMDYAGRGPVAHLRQPRGKTRGRSANIKRKNDDDSSASQSSSSADESSSPSTSDDDSDNSSSSASASPSPKNPRTRRSLIPPVPQSPLRLRQKSSGIVGFNGDEDQLWCMPLKPSAVLEVANQVIRALRYLHKKQIAHRDIKPDNVLVHTDGRICLADFGVSEMLNEVEVSEEDNDEDGDEKKDSSNNLTESTTTIKSRVSNDTIKGGGDSASVRSGDSNNLLPNNLLNLQVPGTRHFHAPELLGFKPASLTLLKYNGTSPTTTSLNNTVNGSRPTSKSKEENSSVVFCYGDIWSVGVMLAFLLFGKPPFDGNNATSLQNNILHEDPTYPDNAAELLQYYEIYGRLPAETKRDHYARIKKECGNRRSSNNTSFEPNLMSASDNTSSSTRSLNQYPISSPLGEFGTYLNNTTSQDGSAANNNNKMTPSGVFELSSSLRSSSNSFKEVASWGLWKEVLGGLLTKDPTKRMTLADVRNSKLFALANDGKVSERRASSTVVGHGISVIPTSGAISGAIGSNGNSVSGGGNDESIGSGGRKRVGKGFADFKKKAIVPTTATSHSSSTPRQLQSLNSTINSGDTSGGKIGAEVFSGSAYVDDDNDIEDHNNDDIIHEDESDTHSEEDDEHDAGGGTAEGRLGGGCGHPVITDRDVVQAIKIVTRSSESFARKKPVVTLVEEEVRLVANTSPNQLMETVSPHNLPRDGENPFIKTNKKSDVLSDTRTSVSSDITSTNLTSTTNSEQKRKDKNISTSRSEKKEKKAKKAKDRENETPEEKKERKRLKKEAKRTKETENDTFHNNSHSHLVDFKDISDRSAAAAVTLPPFTSTGMSSAGGRGELPAMAGVVSPVGTSTVTSLDESGNGSVPLPTSTTTTTLTRQDSVYTLGRGNSTVRRGVGGPPVTSHQSFTRGSLSIHSSSINANQNPLAAPSSSPSTTTTTKAKALPTLGVVVNTPSLAKTPIQPHNSRGGESPPISAFSILNTSQNGGGSASTPGSGMDDPFFASIISDSPHANSGLMMPPPTYSPKAGPMMGGMVGGGGGGFALGAISPVARLGGSGSGGMPNTSTTTTSGPSPLFSRLRPGSDSTGPSVYGTSSSSSANNVGGTGVGGLLGRVAQSSVALKSPGKRDVGGGVGAGGVLGTRSQSSLHTRRLGDTTLPSTNTNSNTFASTTSVKDVSATPPGTRTMLRGGGGGASSMGGVPLQQQQNTSSGSHEASPPSAGSIRVRRRIGQGSVLNGPSTSLMLTANDLEMSQGSSSASISSNPNAPHTNTTTATTSTTSPSQNNFTAPLGGFSPPLSTTTTRHQQGSTGLPAPLGASGTYSRPLIQPGGVHQAGSPALLPSSSSAVRRSGSGSRGRNLPSLMEGSEREDSMLRSAHPTPPSGAPPTQLGRAPSLKNSQT